MTLGTRAPIARIHRAVFRERCESTRLLCPAQRREIETARANCWQHCACVRVLGVAASSGIVWSCDGIVSRRVWHCDSSQRTCAAFPACFLLLFIFYCWLCCLPGMISILAVPLFNGRLLHTVMGDVFLLLFCCFCPHAVPASLLCVPRTARKEDWRDRPDAAMKCEYFLFGLLPFVTVAWLLCDLSLLLLSLCFDGELVCAEGYTQVTGVMAMTMTGRVLLVCALCVLWCVAGGVYARDVDTNALGGCMASGVLGENGSHMPDGCNKTAITVPLRSVLPITAVEASDGKGASVETKNRSNSSENSDAGASTGSAGPGGGPGRDGGAGGSAASSGASGSVAPSGGASSGAVVPGGGDSGASGSGSRGAGGPAGSSTGGGPAAGGAGAAGASGSGSAGGEVDGSGGTPASSAPGAPPSAPGPSGGPSA
ncbi:mucin-associated surface protein (MASP), partial [Trypanosoma cruzi]